MFCNTHARTCVHTACVRARTHAHNHTHTRGRVSGGTWIQACFFPPQVKFLEEHCEGYLKKNITPDVCVGTWLFAEKYSLPILSQTAAAMASDEIDQVVKSDEFLQLPKAMLLIILGSQRNLSMDDICRTILRWVEKEPESRQAHLVELLPFVSFPQLSPVYIDELMNYFDHPFRKYMASKRA